MKLQNESENDDCIQLRPPPPAVYLFVLDVSRLAVESGYLSVVCNTIAEELVRLPGDARTHVGFLAVDSAIHFFSMPENVSQPQEIIMLDVEGKLEIAKVNIPQLIY